jgi:hypothetical protein
MTDTTMAANLLHSLHILTVLVVKGIREELAVLAVLNVLLTIEEPVRDLVLAWVLHNSNDALKVCSIHLTSTLAHVNFGLAADNSSVATTATLNGSQGELDLLLAINVGVEDTENVLEGRLLGNVQGLHAATGKGPVSKAAHKLIVQEGRARFRPSGDRWMDGCQRDGVCASTKAYGS